MYQLTLKIENDSSLEKLVEKLAHLDLQVIELGGYDLINMGTNKASYPYDTPTVANLFKSPYMSPSLFVGLAKLLHAPWGLALLSYFDFYVSRAVEVADTYWFTTFDRKTITWSGFESVDEKERYCHSAGILAIDHQNFLEINTDERYLALNYYDEIAKENLVAVFKYKC